MTAAIDNADAAAAAVTVFQWHKSIGLTVLILSLLRLGWRLGHAVPALPGPMSKWGRGAARLTHRLFYVFMIAVPLSGWLYVSTQWRGDIALNVPTLWFSWLHIPHLFDLNLASQEQRESFSGLFLTSHQTLVWSMTVLLVLHVAAALKHHLLDHDDVFIRMLPNAKNSFRLGISSTIVVALGIVAYQFLPGAELSNKSSTLSSEPATQALITSTGWQIDPSVSVVGFSGVHAGASFEGRFNKWQAMLDIDKREVTRSKITAIIEVASATDGIPLHDSTLPEAEWFDVKNFPQAYYRTTRIKVRHDGRYDLEGTLELKGRKVGVSTLILSIKDEQATIEGLVTVNRADINMGMESDPDGSWVSMDIGVSVHVLASVR